MEQFSKNTFREVRLAGERDFTVTDEERRTLMCSQCGKSDEFYKDAHGIFCRRCGPSVHVVNRKRE